MWIAIKIFSDFLMIEKSFSINFRFHHWLELHNALAKLWWLRKRREKRKAGPSFIMVREKASRKFLRTRMSFRHFQPAWTSFSIETSSLSGSQTSEEGIKLGSTMVCSPRVASVIKLSNYFELIDCETTWKKGKVFSQNHSSLDWNGFFAVSQSIDCFVKYLSHR